MCVLTNQVKFHKVKTHARIKSMRELLFFYDIQLFQGIQCNRFGFASAAIQVRGEGPFAFVRFDVTHIPAQSHIGKACTGFSMEDI